MTTPTERIRKALAEYDAASNGREEALATGALMTACNPDAIRSLLTANDEAEAAVKRLREALADVVDTDWAYLGKDADTGNPDSLYSRVRRGRIALSGGVSPQ